jgi:hypothetical protein
MRIETTSVPQSLVESTQLVDKKELIGNDSSNNSVEESASFIPSPLGSSRTYSLASLKSAVDYHAKFMTVAENNLTAANHSGAIPRGILDRLNPVG